MRKNLQSVLTNIQNQRQLHLLLKKTNTAILFVSEQEQWHLFLSDAEKTEIDPHRVIITGAKEYIELALLGKVPLRKLQKLNQLEIQGNFRQILLIEALLLLSREKSVV